MSGGGAEATNTLPALVGMYCVLVGPLRGGAQCCERTERVWRYLLAEVRVAAP